VIFNAGIMLQGVAGLATSLGFFLALRLIRINAALAALEVLSNFDGPAKSLAKARDGAMMPV
jgi:hypothetical protein